MSNLSNESVEKEIIEIQKKLERSPDDPALLNRIGGLWYLRGKLAEAERAYRRAIAIVGNHAAYHNNLANVLMDAGKTKDGIEEYRRAIQLDGDAHSEATVNLELAELENRIITDRIRFFSQSIELNVNAAESHTALGCASILEGKPGLALDAFRKALSLDDANRAAAENIAYTHSLLASDEPAAGLDAVHALIKRFPNASRLYLYRGDLYDVLGDTGNAIDDYIRAAELDDRLLDAFELAARAGSDDEPEASVRVRDFMRRRRKWLESLDRSCEYDIATETARLALMTYLISGSSAETASDNAAKTRWRDELRDAARALNAWRQTHPHQTPGWADAARLEARLEKILENPESERRVLLDAVKVLPDEPGLLFDLGTTCLSGGALEQAVERLTRASFAAPEDAPILHALRYAFETLRIYKRERFYFERAVRQDPKDADAYARMSRAETAINNAAEAEKYAREAVAMMPSNPDALTALGFALAKAGRKKEAADSFKRVLEINPEQSDAHQGLTTILLSDRDTLSQGLDMLNR